MYLKRLELSGFKTFADRTELEFAPGITAIVGPNGSGKSNLSDAVRWALGEQRPHTLRGTKTEDFIFAGSAKRRAHGLAQVGLLLDNADGALPLEFSEVGVMRRATRGGGGEFFLHGLPCRLRDVQLLFLGTGLGGRSYALISQGEVDAVLNASPQERRLLLEEAAGLARYKRRRHESLRKLEHAEAHLQRVRDLLTELRAQHAYLAEQAEAARQHRTHLQEIQHLERALLADDARRLRVSTQRSATQTEQARARLGELADAAETARREAETHYRNREALIRAWEAEQRRLLDVVREQAAAGTALARAQATLAAHDQEDGRLQEAAASLHGDQDRLHAELAAIEAERQGTEAAVASLQAELAEWQAAMEQQERRRAAQAAEIEAGTARHASSLAARAEIGQRVAGADARLSLLDKQEQVLRARQRRVEERLGAVSAEAAEWTTRVRTLEGSLDTATSALAAASERLQALEGERAALDREQRAAEARRHRLESRLQALEEATAHFVGYEEGARSLLLAQRESPDLHPGILGALVDQIEVEPAYRAAVEAALGRRLFCLLTRGTSDVRTALAAVRANGRGAVAFLPLDRLAALPPDRFAPQTQGSATLDDPGVLGPAAGFVSAGGEARRAVEALLRDVIVVADLDRGLALIAAGHRGRAVTVAGEVLSPDGVVTVRGGQNGHGSPLSRRGDVEAARLELGDVTAELEEHHRRGLALARQIHGAREEVARCEAARASGEAAVTNAQSALAAASRERTRLPLDLEELGGEITETATLLAGLRGERSRLVAESETLDAAAREGEAAVAEARRIQDLDDREAEELRERSAAVRLRLAGLEATGRGLTARRDDFEGRRAGVAATHDRILTSSAAMAEERPHLDAKVRDAEATLQRLAEVHAEAQRTLSALEADRAGHDASHAASVDQARRADEEARSGEATLHRVEIRAAQAEAEWAAVEGRLTEAGLPWAAAEALPLPVPRDEARGRLEALRGLVAAMGPVNMRAIDEQEALTARIERMGAQVEDLDGARAALAQLVTRLDDILRVRFHETFDAVSAEFGRLFHRLFEGGSAHLELVAGDPETATEPGLEVVARLPGKPPRALAALSGGERVLVALSLLFAMLRVHPSPFCVFDEVEAALDDANTRRFTTLLRELAEISQIIIITHNKGTMEAADILYGITMQEPGVSSVLSVRLGARPPLSDGRPDPARPAEVVPAGR